MKNNYELSIAAKDDSGSIKELFEKTSYSHLIDLQFRRGDDPYSSFMNEDNGATVILARNPDNHELIGMGACSYHDILINGEVKRGAYINGLKILPQYQKQYITLLPNAVRYMFENTNEYTDIYYATVLLQAKSTQSLFEKKRSFMPYFQKQCVYTSFLFSPSRKTYGLKLEKGNVENLDEFYKENLAGYNFAPLSRHLNGAKDEDFITWRKDGKILASCVIFNNQKNKNYYLNGYGGIFKILSHFPTRLFGYPKLPKPGRTVDNVSLSMLMFDKNLSAKDKAHFICTASSFAKEHNVITVGISDNDPSYESFRYIRHIKYSSILYTLNRKDIIKADNKPIYIDISYM